MGTISVRLDEQLAEELDVACARAGCTRSAIVRTALMRHLFTNRFNDTGRELIRYREAAGWLTDEDVSGAIS